MFKLSLIFLAALQTKTLIHIIRRTMFFPRFSFDCMQITHLRLWQTNQSSVCVSVFFRKVCFLFLFVVIGDDFGWATVV